MYVWSLRGYQLNGRSRSWDTTGRRAILVPLPWWAQCAIFTELATTRCVNGDLVDTQRPVCYPIGESLHHDVVSCEHIFYGYSNRK